MKILTTNDIKWRDRLIKQMRENGGYCPCAPPFLWDDNHKCVCKKFKEAVANGIEGPCNCGLYIAVNEQSKF